MSIFFVSVFFRHPQHCLELLRFRRFFRLMSVAWAAQSFRLSSSTFLQHGQSPRLSSSTFVMRQRLHSNAKVTAFETWRLLGLKSTVACVRIANVHSPQETTLLWAPSHDSRQEHMVVFFFASTIDVLICQGKVGQVQEFDVHFREQCNAFQPPTFCFPLISSAIFCTCRLEHHPYYPNNFLPEMHTQLLRI